MEEATLRSLIEAVALGKRYCFILGAGASKTSGIKTGEEMAREWLGETEKIELEMTFQEWIKEKKIDKDDPGSSYSEIYERRFKLDPAHGFIRLQNEMKEALPSPGYYYLAEIIYNTQNKLVITTNFDSLTEDSLYISRNEKALVINHESLAKYINPLPDKPTVIKLHRDLLLEPINSEAESSTVSKKWESSLKKIMNLNTPIIIGYGGNDESLMGVFDTSASKDKNIYWCYKTDNPVNERIKKLIEKYRGFLIPIDNFDNTMKLFAECLNCKFSENTIKKVTSERSKKLVNKYKKLMRIMKIKSDTWYQEPKSHYKLQGEKDFRGICQRISRWWACFTQAPKK
jgi:hypothetical protein